MMLKSLDFLKVRFHRHQVCGKIVLYPEVQFSSSRKDFGPKKIQFYMHKIRYQNFNF